jgi:tryptophanyl-tRNA synthetase
MSDAVTPCQYPPKKRTPQPGKKATQKSVDAKVHDAKSEKTNSVTPYCATAGEGAKAFEYEKLIAEFGSKPVDATLIARMEKLTGKPAHPWLRRGMFFSHRDFNLILDYVRNSQTRARL